jgi:hypothetical protein
VRWVFDMGDTMTRRVSPGKRAMAIVPE